MNVKKLKLWKKQVLILGLGLFVILVCVIPLRLAIALHRAPKPQAILVLEGDTERIRFAAQFSKQHPTLPLWISGNPKGLRLNQEIFQQANVPTHQVHYDFCATDTVTNFTCNVVAFTKRDIQHVYVITSDYHMPRSQAIATIVFGSRGIVITPIKVPTPRTSVESLPHIARDCLRSLIWLVTGRTGASLRNQFSK